MTTDKQAAAEPSIDWTALAGRLREESAKLVHQDGGPTLYGDDFYAEALRRVFSYVEPHPARRPDLPYDTVSARTGLVTEGQFLHTLNAHTVMDRLGRESAEAQVREMRAEVRRVYAEARTDLAREIREHCNERRVPARLRREGVLLAAQWLDPQPVNTATPAKEVSAA